MASSVTSHGDTRIGTTSSWCRVYNCPMASIGCASPAASYNCLIEYVATTCCTSPVGKD